MFIARPARPAGCEIVAASRSFTSTAAAVAVNTTSAHGLAVPPEVADGDFLVLGYALGVTTGVTLNPTLPAGFTSRRSYTPASLGWCLRTLTAFYDAAEMGDTLNVPMNIPSGSTFGGLMLTLVAVRGVDPTAPIASTTGATSTPATGAAATTTFPSVTSTKARAAFIYTLGGYLASARADDATWSAGTTELADTGGPRTNSSNAGTAHRFAAGHVREAAGAAGSVTCTTTTGGNRSYRDGCVLLLNPQE